MLPRLKCASNNIKINSKIIRSGTWFYVPWPTIIRENRQNSLGVKFAHKLSCLEGFSSLLGLVMVPDLARNNEIMLPNDNAGFVHVFQKKHSSCPYTYTVAKALYDVANGLNCKVNHYCVP